MEIYQKEYQRRKKCRRREIKWEDIEKVRMGRSRKSKYTENVKMGRYRKSKKGKIQKK